MTDDKGFLRNQRVLFLVNVDWFFLSHRLPVAVAARRAGADVVVASADTGRGAAIEANGFRFVALPLSRRGMHPAGELRAVIAIARMFRRERPTLIHQVAVKPILYGSLIGAVVQRKTPRLNAISGLGFTFSQHRRAKWLNRPVRLLYRIALRIGSSRTIFQNRVDLDSFVTNRLIAPDRAVLIRGSGVDLEQFHPRPMPQVPVVLLASRMLWEKGVADFVEAARLVRHVAPEVRFVLAGGPDAGNPTAISQTQLEAWRDEGVVEWLGHRTDMADVLAQATVVVLPTYYPEGVPKVLLEAGASARPVVATNIPGCREIVTHGVNGLLVPPRDPEALANALVGLLNDRERCQALGDAGRRIVEEQFAESLVVGQTLEQYCELLGITMLPAAHHLGH
jgi:glycosyltransferase involved in cell wall biosynthesis